MPTATPFTNYYFQLALPGLDQAIGTFSHCRGLELRFQIYPYREGGNNDFVHQLPGPVEYPNLVLMGMVTDQDALFKWFLATATQAERKEITLTLKSRNKSRSWTFADAFPVSWIGPTLEAGGSQLGTETLEIAHSGLKLA
jgi:phage tail-like protein